ncbi:2-oxoacid:acceptor oxidoreductase family protein [bacterium]|nr:2-oxoacid:acceptor oxidoreductase family protein [bacterium]
MKNRYEIRFSGSGGQGMITAGKIFSLAAGLYSGKNAVQSQSYGAASRGGASKSDVIISDEEIIYPRAMEIDLLIVLSGEACSAYCSNMANTTLIVDENLVINVPHGYKQLIKIPITEMTKKITGSTMSSNIFSLGIAVAISNIIEPDTVEKVLKDKFKNNVLEKNIQAFNKGYEMGLKYRE